MVIVLEKYCSLIVQLGSSAAQNIFLFRYLKKIKEATKYNGYSNFKNRNKKRYAFVCVCVKMINHIYAKEDK